MLIQYSLDMFPFHFLNRGRFLPEWGRTLNGLKTTYQLADGDGFAQVIHGTPRMASTAVAILP